MVYDTLYGVDVTFAPQPQMAAGHVVEDRKRKAVALEVPAIVRAKRSPPGRMIR